MRQADGGVKWLYSGRWGAKRENLKQISMSGSSELNAHWERQTETKVDTRKQK